MNAKIELEKEKIMKEKMEKEATTAIIAHEETLKDHDSSLNVTKPKSKRSSVKS